MTVAPVRLARVDVEGQIGEAEDLARARRSPQKGAHAGEELVEGERLGEVVVGAGIEAGDAVRDEVAHREHQDGGRIAVGAEPPAHLEAVDARHQKVEHDGVDVLGRQHVERFGSLAREPHFVAFQREGAAHRPANGRLVVHHEDSHFGQVSPPVLRMS